MNIPKVILQNVSNIPGWRTRRKIVVIEGDDWGSIRMPSLSVYDALTRKGFELDAQDGYLGLGRGPGAVACTGLDMG